MSTDLAVIEAALAAATPGPWEASEDPNIPDRAVILTAWCYEGEDAELVTDWCTIPDASLIANAPAWLAELVERVRTTRAEVERLALSDYNRLQTTVALQDLAAERRERAETAEAAIARVRDLCDRQRARGDQWADLVTVSAVMAALDGDSGQVNRFTAANGPELAPEALRGSACIWAV